MKELKEKSKKNQKSEITITNKSTKEEVVMFLKHKFNFSQKTIESLDLDGEILFSLEENDINDVDELSREEKDKFINYLKESKFLNDIDVFSLKEKVIKILKDIIYFIETFNKIRPIQMTDLTNNLKSTYESIQSEQINEEEIKKAIYLLLKYNFDVRKEATLIQFYEYLSGKEEALLLIKIIKDSNLGLRNLYEFVDEEEYKTINDNFIDVYIFFKNIMDNQELKTDEELLLIFQKHFDNDKDIINKLKLYLNTFGEIYYLYQPYYKRAIILYNILSESTFIFIKKKNLIYSFIK